MRSMVLLGGWLLFCLLAAGQEHLTIQPRSPGGKILFRTGDRLYMRADTNLERVVIQSDTREETGKREIRHVITKEHADTLHIGVFTGPGLYILQADTILRGLNGDRYRQEERYIRYDSIGQDQTGYYIYAQLVGGRWKGIHWWVGLDDTIRIPRLSYLYCYAPGVVFDTGTSTSLLRSWTPSAGDSAERSSLRQLTDSLLFGFANTQREALQSRMDSLRDVLCGTIDSGKVISFSVYLHTGEPIRLLVVPDTGTVRLNEAQGTCTAVFQSLITMMAYDTNVISTATRDLLLPICGQLFQLDRSEMFDRVDPYNTEQSLLDMDAAYVDRDPAIYADVIQRNASLQIVVLCKLIGRKPVVR